MAKKNAGLTIGEQPDAGQRSGNPAKAPHHEGPAGDGPVKASKFNKDTGRDSVGEKEPGKSRGPGGAS